MISNKIEIISTGREMHQIIKMANRVMITTHKTAQDKSRKRSRGFSRKELGRPADKYAEKEFWKRAKNVQMQRASRTKHHFDETETILYLKMVWPYDQGMTKFLEELREKSPLGAGW
jgi:hypothetical protein